MNKEQGGFTLIELLVVISIIGVLATIGMVSLNGARARARDARRRSDLRNIVLALEQYNSQYGTYKVSGSIMYGSYGGGYYSYRYASYANSISTGLENVGYTPTPFVDPRQVGNNSSPQYMVYTCDDGIYAYAHLEMPSSADIAAYQDSCGPALGLDCEDESYLCPNFAIGHR